MPTPLDAQALREITEQSLEYRRAVVRKRRKREPGRIAAGLFWIAVGMTGGAAFSLAVVALHLFGAGRGS